MENNNSSISLDFLNLLTILFVGLKLTGFITWSWWWVLSPIIVQGALVLILGLIVLIYHLFFE